MNQIMGVYPSKSGKPSRYSCVAWKFMLDAPFDISNKCCYVFKKSISHKYNKATGRHPMTAEMASESRLRTQKWLQNGCNGFDMKEPKSMPMAFWTEQDVLLYIKLNDLEIAPPYGNIVIDNENEQVDGQMSIFDYDGVANTGIFDEQRPTLKTTGYSRTGCFACQYGSHMPNDHRMATMKKLDPKLYDWCLRGGTFDERGKWVPKGGLGLWFIYLWIKKYKPKLYKQIPIEDLDYYRSKYTCEQAEMWLNKEIEQ